MRCGTGTSNMQITAAMIKPVIVKAAVKAANFAEISAFMINSSAKVAVTAFWAALQMSLDHCTGDVVGRLRTINRIGAHYGVGNSLNEKVSSACATVVAAMARVLLSDL
jgi:hypothetical protein